MPSIERHLRSAAVMRIGLSRPSTWIVAGIVATVALRLPYVDEALSRDEGGDTYIAQALGAHGPFAYGPYFVDRPPLLLALYRLAALAAGTLGIRVLGLLLALGLVAMIVLLATRLGGPTAAPAAAACATVLLCSQATGVVATPSELLAAAPSCLAVLLIIEAPDRLTSSRRRLAIAGAAAMAAFLIKQSFVDGLFACVAGLLAMLVDDTERERGRQGMRTFLAGALAPLAALTAWAVAAGRTPQEVWYAVLGFRLDAASVLSNGQVGRLGRLGFPLLHSGLAVALPLCVAAVWALPARRPVKVALVTWLAAGLGGVLGGGSYSPAYLIELMPVVSVGVGLVAARRRRIGVAATAAVAVLALIPTLRGAVHDSADAYAQGARAVGGYVHERAIRGQTVYVLYARANVLYYAGLPSPFPYHWALMMRAAHHAQGRLRALLASRSRPTWIVAQDSPRAFGLDRSGETARLIARYYHPVARVCSTPILLARGAAARPAPARPPDCR